MQNDPQQQEILLSDKQSHILDVAQKLFAEKGFSATSIRDIATTAKVNLAMISYYFGSKEKMFLAIFKRHATHVKIELENLLEDKSLTPPQKMELLIDRYLNKLFGKSDFHKIMLRQQINPVSEEVQEMMQEMKNNNQSLVSKIIQQGQKENIFKKNIDIPMLMATMLGTSYHLLTTQNYYRKAANLEHQSEEDFQKTLHKKLAAHLKSLFKAILTHE